MHSSTLASPMWTCLCRPPLNWQVGFIGVSKLKWSNSQKKWRAGKSYPLLWATCSVWEVHKQHSIGSLCTVYVTLQEFKFSTPELLTCTNLQSKCRFFRTTSYEIKNVSLSFCDLHDSRRVIWLSSTLSNSHKVQNRKFLSLVHGNLATLYLWQHPMKQSDFALLISSNPRFWSYPPCVLDTV